MSQILAYQSYIRYKETEIFLYKAKLAKEPPAQRLFSARYWSPGLL